MSEERPSGEERWVDEVPHVPYSAEPLTTIVYDLAPGVSLEFPFDGVDSPITEEQLASLRERYAGGERADELASEAGARLVLRD